MGDRDEQIPLATALIIIKKGGSTRRRNLGQVAVRSEPLGAGPALQSLAASISTFAPAVVPASQGGCRVGEHFGTTEAAASDEGRPRVDRTTRIIPGFDRSPFQRASKRALRGRAVAAVAIKKPGVQSSSPR